MTRNNDSSSERFSASEAREQEPPQFYSIMMSGAAPGTHILLPDSGPDYSQTLIDKKILPAMEIHNGSSHNGGGMLKGEDLKLHFSRPQTPFVRPGEAHSGHSGGNHLKGIGNTNLKDAKPSDNDSSIDIRQNWNSPKLDFGSKGEDLKLHFSAPKTPAFKPGEEHKGGNSHTDNHLEGVGKLNLKKVKPTDN